MLKKSISSGKDQTLFDSEFSIKNIDGEQINLSKKVNEINAMPEESLIDQVTKQKKWEDLMVSPRIECLRRACDIYTYAFYREIKSSDVDWKYADDTFNRAFQIPYTRTVYQALHEIQYLDSKDCNKQDLTDEFKHEVESAARSNRFFHWCVEFPEVFTNGGFDVMCGNPPWDKIKVEDKKWFESQGRLDIVNAGTAAQRKKTIEELAVSDPQLFAAYQEALANAEAISRFVRFCGRYPLTAVGDIDLFPLFAEHCMNCSKMAWGVVIPTAIAVNDSYKSFFAKLIDENRLISLFDFENREGLFDAVHRMYKFCLLTAGQSQNQSRTVSGGFYLSRLDHLFDPKRIYNLQTTDFSRLNPNTKTCPVFRSSLDAKITSKIYCNSTVLYNERTEKNPWRIRLNRMFDMANDSEIFKTFSELEKLGASLDNRGVFLLNNVEYVPLYEGKMFYLYKNHYGSFPIEGARPNSIDDISIDDFQDPCNYIMPWYWIPKCNLVDKFIKRNSKGDIQWQWSHSWQFVYRLITRAVDERTFITSFVPDYVGFGNSVSAIYSELDTYWSTILLGMMSSMPMDYAVRQKVGGINMSSFFVKQFPVLTPAQIKESLYDSKIVERVAELCYFNHDLDGWMEELWEDKEMTDELRKSILSRLDACNGGSHNKPEPFIYNEDRRAIAQAELDAIFAHLYGLNTEDLRYILDPEDVCGVGCINETFRVLKDREIREFGEYRTKRLVMEAWNKFGFDK